MTTYDGSGKLGDAIATLYGCSPKNNNRIAELVADAKTGLGITSKTKKLPDDVKLAIYQWHCNRLQSTANDAVNILSQSDSNEAVEIISQDNIQSVDINSQATSGDAVELYSHDGHQEVVEIISQTAQPENVNINSQPDGSAIVKLFSQTPNNEGVELYSQTDSNQPVEINSQYADTALIRIAFYIQRQGKRVRQVIALDGYYLNALMLATGITKQDVPKWVQQAVDGWAAFDSALPITKQVKLLLIRELTKSIDKAGR